MPAPDSTGGAFLTPQVNPLPLLSKRRGRASPCPVPSHWTPMTTLQVGDDRFRFTGKSPRRPAPYPSSPSLCGAPLSISVCLSVCQGHILPLFHATSPCRSLAGQARLRDTAGHPEGSHSRWEHGACQDRVCLSVSRGRRTYCFDIELVPAGPGTDQPFTSLGNKTHGVLSILARAVGTAPGGPGSAVLSSA